MSVDPYILFFYFWPQDLSQFQTDMFISPWKIDMSRRTRGVYFYFPRAVLGAGWIITEQKNSFTKRKT